MRWRPGAGRGQIEDRRGMGGMGGMALPIGGGGGLIGVIALLAYLLLAGGGGGGLNVPIEQFPSAPTGQPLGDTPDQTDDFVAFVVDDVQDTWTRLFRETGREYEPTKLVLFEQATQTGCGSASSETGPFYCPLDRKVYLDLGFFRELRDRFRAPGDFAQAYVIAHEFGHHVQTILGINAAVRREQQEHPDEANELSVKMELQADCFAGVWAHSAYSQQQLSPGDLDEGLAAASAVGDDRIQRQTQGRVDPESWTHGSAEQRSTWFRRGFDGGDPNACDTFS